ncbi:hypothetical protein NDU88_006605 [Pleurodeles waltl]|uniref:Uncharacterized protein n=1 Tax=Pleurodeles waltl TaxID=8319 RepID=A0AAV7MHW7_PLEWA|nr:hypothetical protein NDU88_006605 [Pleurodeles waltl]
MQVSSLDSLGDVVLLVGGIVVNVIDGIVAERIIVDRDIVDGITADSGSIGRVLINGILVNLAIFFDEMGASMEPVVFAIGSLDKTAVTVVVEW